MMKHLSILLCLFLLSCAKDKEVIVVQYTDSSGAELLSSPIFDTVEIITLHGEGAPFFGSWSNIAVKNDIYYVEDTQLGKIHLFDATGKYLNSVGGTGRGPAEYQYIDDMIIEDNGDVSVYSSQQGTLYTYTPQGYFLGSTEYSHKSGNFNRANGFNYHYYGTGSGLPYQLYITNRQNQSVGSGITSYMVVNNDFAPFSAFGNTLYLCPYYGGEVYRLTDGKITVAYTFDFGIYNIPADYYRFGDMFEAFDFLMPKTFAAKNRFFENQKYAVLQAGVANMESLWARYIYGLSEKATSTWNWFYMDDDDFMNDFSLKYMDDSHIYFAADPEMVIDAPITERFPALSTLDVDTDILVIFKCKLK
ncbi:MAG: 6-bladed beta-propeller [Bacteroidales bacterium]|nr:6-bladed beta-propeller [Bacteroidales bacterium]